MAKKKTSSHDDENIKLAEQLDKEINSEFGDGIVQSADEFLEHPPQIISISPSLDIGARGGIPEGSWVISSGPEKCGKTVTALTFAAKCQRPEYGGRFVYYFDFEHRLKEMNLRGIKGLNFKLFKRISSVKGKILSAEENLALVERCVKTHPNCLCILDSTSALCSAKEMTDENSATTRNSGAKLLAQFCRKMSGPVRVNNCIIWLIQHLIANTSGYGPSLMEDGGRAVQYVRDTMFRATKVEDWTIGSGENVVKIGQKVTWRMITSATGGIPGTLCESYIRYGVGVDDIKEIVEKASNLPCIHRSGTWYTYQGEAGEIKVQGIDNLRKHFEDNPTDLKKLFEDVYKTYLLKVPPWPE